jgi:hypothetical protein
VGLTAILWGGLTRLTSKENLGAQLTPVGETSEAKKGELALKLHLVDRTTPPLRLLS